MFLVRTSVLSTSSIITHRRSPIKATIDSRSHLVSMGLRTDDSSCADFEFDPNQNSDSAIARRRRNFSKELEHHPGMGLPLRTVAILDRNGPRRRSYAPSAGDGNDDANLQCPLYPRKRTLWIRPAALRRKGRVGLQLEFERNSRGQQGTGCGLHWRELVCSITPSASLIPQAVL